MNIEHIPDNMDHVSNISKLEDGTELFWIPIHYGWGTKTIRKNGKDKKITIITDIYRPVFRVKLSLYHHKTVSGYLPCLVEDPSPEYPNIVPWSSDWIYADNNIYIRRAYQ